MGGTICVQKRNMRNWCPFGCFLCSLCGRHVRILLIWYQSLNDIIAEWPHPLPPTQRMLCLNGYNVEILYIHKIKKHSVIDAKLYTCKVHQFNSTFDLSLSLIHAIQTTIQPSTHLKKKQRVGTGDVHCFSKGLEHCYTLSNFCDQLFICAFCWKLTPSSKVCRWYLKVIIFFVIIFKIE